MKPSLRTNKRAPDSAKAAIGVAGVVLSEHLSANSFLANYAGEDPEAATDPVYRREILDGRTHTVFPVVMAVEGVLNDALVTADELRKSSPAWNGRPVVLLHPEEMGLPISASQDPDVFERRIGTIFSAVLEGKRLKAELWIDEQKMDYLGASDLVSSMLNGEIVEVSTGYFSDDILEQGEFEGTAYVMRHVNLRPDHLALLPGQVGACSIMDGCGAPRVNQSRGLGVKVKEALSVLSKAVGIHTNSCDCQECKSMKKLAAVRADFEKLKLYANAKFLAAVNAALALAADSSFKANKALESKHLKMLEDMDEGQLEMMAAMIQAYKATDPAAAAEEEEVIEELEEEEDPNAMKAQQRKAAKAKEPLQITRGELDSIVANAVTKAISEQVPAMSARSDVVGRLKANARNPFSDEELATLPVSALEKTELALRPEDYSGAGGFSVHSGADDDDEPMAVIANRQQAELAEARSKRSKAH